MDADKDLFDLLPGTAGVMLRFNGRIMKTKAGKAKTSFIASNASWLVRACVLHLRYLCVHVCVYVCLIVFMPLCKTGNVKQ